MKFGVIVFPGSNGDQDLLYTLGDILHQDVVPLWHKDHDLQGCDFVLLPGGFSSGAGLRSGAKAESSPIMTEVVAHAKRGGYVMGVGNGFQVLCEAGLLPGELRQNPSGKFICKNIFIKPESRNTIVTSSLDPSKAYRIPIANGNGNYFASRDVIKALEDDGQILFRYCDEKGLVTEESNPNGSTGNIAGIANKGKNVLGMMPHPERAADFELENLDGREIFDSILSVVNS